jgi:hypothetical protein
MGKNIYDEGGLSEKATIKDYFIAHLVSQNELNMRHKSACSYSMKHKLQGPQDQVIKHG